MPKSINSYNSTHVEGLKVEVMNLDSVAMDLDIAVLSFMVEAYIH